MESLPQVITSNCLQAEPALDGRRQNCVRPSNVDRQSSCVSALSQLCKRNRLWRRWAISFLLLQCIALSACQLLNAQDFLQPPTDDVVADAVYERSSLKVAVPPAPDGVVTAGLESSQADIKGMTYVAIAGGLERVFRGADPSTLTELKMLEAQQTLVAQKIEQVTVNVQQGAAQGSGVIITPDGYVLTAAHVAGGMDRDAWLMLHDGTRVKARTLGMNRNKDAGLLKIVESRESPWPHATLGRSRDLREGQWVIASGHPGGWKPDRGSVIRVGRVSKIRSDRDSSGANMAHTLFTDCALIGGDSGGPLFTLEGKLIGIHSRIGTEVSENMHVPIDVFDESWDRMVRKEVWGVLPGYQPVIGVKGSGSDDRPVIESVDPGGPAHRAGIEPGDLILKFDGVKIGTFEELKIGVRNKMPGDTVILEVKRGDQVLRVPIVVGVAEN